jgi:hypothetical protein
LVDVEDRPVIVRDADIVHPTSKVLAELIESVVHRDAPATAGQLPNPVLESPRRRQLLTGLRKRGILVVIYMILRGGLWICGRVLRTSPDLTGRVDNPMHNLLVALWIINTSGLLAHNFHRLQQQSIYRNNDALTSCGEADDRHFVK